MRRLVLCMSVLVVVSASTAWGQPYPQRMGIPFRMDPSISGSRSSWHLNIPNGLWDWGEQAVDIGGSSNRGIAGQTPNFNFAITSMVYYTHTLVGGTLGAWHVEGFMDGNEFQLTVPDVPSPPTAVASAFIAATGDPRYDMSRTAIVLERATRSRNINSVAEWPLPVGASWTGPPGTWPIGLLNQIGAITVVTKGSVGAAPLVFAAQQAVYWGKFFRFVPSQIDHVYHMGGSFGSAVGLMIAVTEPDVFDAIQMGAATFSLNSWRHYHEYRGLRDLSQGEYAWFDRNSPIWDSFATFLGHYGLRRHHVDVLQFPELFRTPLLGLNARDDVLLGIGTQEYQVKQQVASYPLPWVDSFTLEEGGHGMIDFANDPLVVDYAWKRMWDLEALAPSGPHPPPGPSGSSRYTTHDEVLRHNRTLPPPTGLSLAWEVGAIDHGVATPPGSVRGAGTGISIATGSSAIHDHGTEKALYTVNLEGFVARHGWQQGSLVEVWRTFTGLHPRSLAVGFINGQDQVIVGSQRGIHYLRASDGIQIAPLCDHDTGKYDHIRGLTIADLSAWHPSFGPGPHTVYVADAEILVVEDRDHCIVLETLLGTATRLRVRTEDHGLGPKPYLYATLARGHIARFRFENVSGQWTVVADMISEYLRFQPLDFDFVDTSSSACSATATTQIVTGGIYYDTGGVNPRPDAWLSTVRIDGTICSEITVNNHQQIDYISSDGWNHVLVGTSPFGGGAIGRVDLSAGTPSFTTLATSRGSFATGTLANVGDIAHFSDRGDIRILDSSGTLINQVPGRTPTTAVDLTVSSTGSWELCVLDRDWYLRRYDAVTGAYVDSIDWLPLRWTCVSPPESQNLPKTIIRTNADNFQPASFELFEYSGTMGDVAGQSHRAAYKAGTVVLARTKEDEHNALIQGTPAQASSEKLASGISCLQTGTGTPVYIHPLMAVDGAGETAILDAIFSPGDRQIVFSNQSGNIWSFPAQPAPTTRVWFNATSGPPTLDNCGPINTATFWARSRDLRTGAAGLVEPTRLGCQDIGCLEVANVAGDDANELIVGARMPDDNGDTLYVLTRVVDGFVCQSAINAGAVSGLLIADLSGDGDIEYVVGTEEGRVRIYDQSLVEVTSFDIGALVAGARGSLWLIPASPEQGREAPMLVIGHSEGISAYTVTGSF